MTTVKDYYCHNCGLFQVGRERCRECGSLDVAYVSDPVPVKREASPETRCNARNAQEFRCVRPRGHHGKHEHVHPLDPPREADAR
jgi:hypothetical protein